MPTRRAWSGSSSPRRPSGPPVSTRAPSGVAPEPCPHIECHHVACHHMRVPYLAVRAKAQGSRAGWPLPLGAGQPGCPEGPMLRHVHGTRAPGAYSAPQPRVASGTPHAPCTLRTSPLASTARCECSLPPTTLLCTPPLYHTRCEDACGGLTLRRLTTADRAASALARAVQGTPTRTRTPP